MAYYVGACACGAPRGYPAPINASADCCTCACVLRGTRSVSLFLVVRYSASLCQLTQPVCGPRIAVRSAAVRFWFFRVHRIGVVRSIVRFDAALCKCSI